MRRYVRRNERSLFAARMKDYQRFLTCMLVEDAHVRQRPAFQYQVSVQGNCVARPNKHEQTQHFSVVYNVLRRFGHLDMQHVTCCKMLDSSWPDVCNMLHVTVLHVQYVALKCCVSLPGYNVIKTWLVKVIGSTA